MFITFLVIQTDIDGNIFKIFGEIFGIIAGIIGIYLSRSKNDKDMKCLWKAFITLVSWNWFPNIFVTAILSVQCIFTTVSSFIGFVANVIALHTSYLSPYHWMYKYDDDDDYEDYDSISEELSLIQILTIETVLFFGKTST